VGGSTTIFYGSSADKLELALKMGYSLSKKCDLKTGSGGLKTTSNYLIQFKNV
jgi:hypothetical protein